MIPYPRLEEAQQRITPHIHVTPLTYDAELDAYIKWENHQITGSFKARGAFNKVLALPERERRKGLVAASAGNHGQGLALVGKLVQAPVILFVSENAVPAKVQAMRALGAEVRLVPGGYAEAERAGLSYATASHSTWISPYNDGQVIAGQATLGLEILDQLPDSRHSTWIVPVGGGGLIAGIGVAIKELTLPAGQAKHMELVGVQSEASPFFHAIYHQGTQTGVVELPSLADGLAGPVEEGSITIPLVQKYVDDFILVSEETIIQAIDYAWKRHKERIEGSAAAALAGVLSGKISSRPVVVVISGGNIQPEVHESIIHEL